MEIKSGITVTFEKEGKSYQGVVTMVDSIGYTIIYTPDKERIEFETIKF